MTFSNRNNWMTAALMALALCMGACSDDEDNTPSNADTDRLEALIDHQNACVEEYRVNYGTYLLNHFDSIRDFAYQFEEAAAWRQAVVTPLRDADVPSALSFLKNHFFNCYNEAWKKEYFPRKVLLCESIYGSTLGVSTMTTPGFHDAAANMNCLAIAKLSPLTISSMTEAERLAYVQKVHYVYLGGYVVNARSNYFVPDAFFDYCASLYNSLIDANRQQVYKFSDEFFYKKGFFRPENDYDTYYGTAESDLISFTHHLLLMNQEECEVVMAYPILKAKLSLVAQALQQKGVDVTAINPLAQRFME